MGRRTSAVVAEGKGDELVFRLNEQTRRINLIIMIKYIE